MTVRDWLDLVFVPAMFLTPLVAASLVRQRPDGNPERARWLMVLLVLATAAGLGLEAVLHFVVEMERANLVWPCFFVLWSGIAMPLCGAKNPAWYRAHPMDAPVRAAYASYRSDRAVGLAVFTLIMTAVMSGLLLALVWVDVFGGTGLWRGIVGGGAGTLLGIGGAVFGVSMGRRRTRITELCASLTLGASEDPA